METDCYISLMQLNPNQKIEEGIIVQNVDLPEEIAILLKFGDTFKFGSKGLVYYNANSTYKSLGLKPFILVMHCKDIETSRVISMRSSLKNHNVFIYLDTNIDEHFTTFSDVICANYLIAVSPFHETENLKLLDGVRFLTNEFVSKFISKWEFNGDELLEKNWIKVKIKTEYLKTFMIK